MAKQTENPAAGNGRAWEVIAGSEQPENTAATRHGQLLVNEQGVIRRATIAEMRRLARLGLVGGAA